MAIQNPIPKTLRKEAQLAIHALAQAEEHAQLAAKAGLPVQEQLDRIKHLKGAMMQLLAVYESDQIEA